ncbi:hypothetical protein AB1Y20_008464 [Prymnesium parvum]|uniref:Uncharacterized protein n=1 Tax=Prymnesium parvum TaxID=97485 RepID=A0AB34IT80_PRYPA
MPLRWHDGDDALSLAAVFGLPPVSSSTDAHCSSCSAAATLPAYSSVCMSSHAGSPTTPPHACVRPWRTCCPRSQPPRRAHHAEIVDSVHSRLRALLQSQDAPEPFIAFGLARRQGTLEPPRRQSRAASPSPSLLRRASLTASPQSVTRAPRNLEEEVAAMTPNTMRQKLVEVLSHITPLFTSDYRSILLVETALSGAAQGLRA